MDLFLSSGAQFSPCRAYRYKLWRTWGAGRPSVCFIMLNPSTADETVNDPTITRCQERAKRLGMGGLVVANLFAFRATEPADMRAADDPVGPENDAAILEIASRPDTRMVIAGWGTHGEYRRRATAVRKLLSAAGIPLHCLALTKDGHPKHPLYVGYDVQPQAWAGVR